MITEAKNKVMTPEAAKTKVATTSKEEYHFAGEGKYVPLTVLASSSEEAQKLWEKDRVEV